MSGSGEQDGKLVLHDWDENKSPHLKRLENAAERQKRYRSRKLSEDLPALRHSDVETKPNQTKPDQIRSDQIIGAQESELEGGGHQDDIAPNTGDHAADIAAFHDKLRNMLADHKL